MIIEYHVISRMIKDAWKYVSILFTNEYNLVMSSILKRDDCSCLHEGIKLHLITNTSRIDCCQLDCSKYISYG